MKLSGLYVITDEHLIPDQQLLPHVQSAVDNGASVIQYRAKTKPLTQQIKQAKALAQICHDAGRLFLVNDNLILAIESQADGVHLGQNDRTLKEARILLGKQAIIGITCHQSLTLAYQAEKDSANYVAFGRFFPSKTKPNAPAVNIDILRYAKTQLSIPIVAIGGITPDNGKPLLSAGADMLAVIHSIFGAKDPGLASKAMHALFQKQGN